MRKYEHYAVSFICYWSLLCNKKMVIKKNHFAETSYHFVDINYYSAGENLKNPILRRIFFASANYHLADANWEKPILHRHFLVEAKISELPALKKKSSNLCKVNNPALKFWDLLYTNYLDKIKTAWYENNKRSTLLVYQIRKLNTIHEAAWKSKQRILIIC